MPGLFFNNVHRSFEQVHAVRDLSMAIEIGTVAVLLGPNGAGKTTTVRLATGALAADAGEIKVNGLDPRVDGNEIRRITGIVPPKPAFYEQLTGRANLEFAATMFDVDHPPIEEAAARFGITPALDQRVGGYSTGMRTRLALARSVLHDPKILLLDEPTAGLDPESARAVLDLVVDLADQGRSVLMCTHLLHEAEGIADQVILLNEGHAWAAGHPSHLTAEFWSDRRVHIDAENREALAAATNYEGVVGSLLNGYLTLELDNLDRLPGIVEQLVADGARLTRVEPESPTLEQLYFEMQRQRRGELGRGELRELTS